jgi:hypothetical protein
MKIEKSPSGSQKAMVALASHLPDFSAGIGTRVFTLVAGLHRACPSATLDELE